MYVFSADIFMIQQKETRKVEYHREQRLMTFQRNGYAQPVESGWNISKRNADHCFNR